MLRLDTTFNICLDLVMGVLNVALSIYGKPEILNSDQGSRVAKGGTHTCKYTSYIHTQTLKDNGIIISMDSKGRATEVLPFGYNICMFQTSLRSYAKDSGEVLKLKKYILMNMIECQY